MGKNYKIILILILNTFIVFNLFSQVDFRFESLSRKDGLSHDNVYAISQDRYGFMWFGTEDGLNRYDGYTFKQFYNEPSNPNSLVSNNFGEILEDRYGNMWFGTHYGGLDKFDPLKNEFTHFISDESNAQSLSSNNIRCLIEDTTGNLWIATSGGGINYFNAQTGKFTRFLHNEKDKNSLSSNDVDALVIDKNNNLWIGTNKSLDYFDLKTRKISHLILGFESYDFERNISVRTLCIDKFGLLWIGTSNGLFLYNPESKRVRKFEQDLINPRSISDDYINKIFEDSNGNIWIGTENGLNLYNRDKDNFTTFFFDVKDRYSLSNNRVWTIFEDKTEILWIATKGGGVNKLDLKRKKFYSLKYQPESKMSLNHPSVYSITGDTAGNVWLGTDGGGICVFQREKATTTHLKKKLTNKNMLSDDQIWSIAYGKGKYWIGMHTGGLNTVQISGNNYNITRYEKTGDSTGICNNQVNTILIDKSDFLWIGTRDGLNKMIDTANNQKPYFITYKKNFNDSNSLSDNYITCLYQDHLGNIWIGTYNSGLNCLDTKTGKIKTFITNPGNPNSLSSNSINTIFEDHLGNLWIGTAGGGLNKKGKDENTFSSYFMKNGLLSNDIKAILEDYQGNLWISSAKGITKFDTSTGAIVNFDVRDGMLADGFNKISAFQDLDGWMYFGTSSGLVYFQPEQILLNQHKPEIVITKFNYMKNNEWFSNDMFISDYHSKKAEFVLDYDKNIFSIEFAALDFTNPEENQFQYKIEQINNNWIDNGNKHSLMVTNLEPGKYVLRIRGTNNDKLFNEEGLSVIIEVRPPFWQTDAFFIIIGILTILIFVSVYSFLLKLKTNKILAYKNHELEQANLKLLESEKNLKSLNETKDKFFSIIAHDLRNPFNPLLSLTEFLDEEYNNLDEKDKHNFIKEIRHGAKRLYDLLENLLQWALTQTRQIKFKQEAINLDELVQSNIELLNINAEKKNISVINNIKEKVKVLADENMLNSIVRNLINNAIKFSADNSEIIVNLKEVESFYEIEIKDKGIGISAENVESLLNGTSRGKIDTKKGKGTGLGLILCKEFVEKNGGIIRIESEPGKGSSFFFTVPRLNVHDLS
ncbi:MAG: two-component regulator propeller domain-containing protein [Bacteroidales bacterium]